MINAFYAAKSGLLESQNNLNVVSNNIANVNTAGFQSQSANFTDLLYTNIQGSDNGPPQNLQTGNGVKLSEVATSFEQGGFDTTGKLLDVAIQGDGFFCTQDGNGVTHYTRAGSFGLSVEGEKAYLVSEDGEYVLGANMQRIEIPTDNGGAITFSSKAGQAGDGVIQLAVVTFSNPYALTRIGDSKYSANASTGAAVLATDVNIMQGALENSNVDIASEMAKLIEAQRGFQLGAKVLQISDEMEQTSNSLRN